MDIVIGKPYLESRTEDSISHSRLCCDIEGVNDDILTLWYEVPSEYEEYLCIERADAFIVSLLPLAMIRSSPEQLVRIICKQSISAKLYHQLVNYYIPVLVDSISYYNDIVLEANISESKLFCKGAVGTGVSGGVDSSYTIARYLNNKISAFRLSHCVYYEMGLYGSFDSDLEKQLLKKTRKITEECGLSYLNIKSNICLALYQAAHAPIVPSVFLGAALALQKLFSTYYYSSAIKASQFSMNEADAAYYDLLNVHCLSSDSLSFYSSGIEVTRMDKIRYIADIDFVQKNLSVCLSPDQNGNNCGKCAKCTRTMAELEVIDKLVNFSRVFNIDSFWKNPGYHWGYVLLKSKTDVFCREIICEYKKTGRKLPLQAYLSRIQKWIERGFTTRNKQRIKVEEIIK